MTTIGIGTVAELESFRDRVNNGETQLNAILTADIDLSSVSSWTPIGTNSNQYVGTFDGNGHTISGLSDKLIYGWSSIVCNTKFKDISIISPRITSSGNYYFIQQPGPNSQIKNCEFNNCNIYYNYDDSSLGIGIVICLAKQINNCCFINCHLECTGNVNNCGAHLCQASYTSNIYAFGCELDASSSGGTHSIAYAPSLVGRYPGYQIQLIDMSNLAVLSTTCSISTSTSSYSYVKGYIGGSFTTESLQSQSSLYIDNTIARSTGGTLNVYTNQEIQMPLSTMQQQSFWTTSSNWYGDGWDFTNTWHWDSTANLPKLRVFQNPKPTMRVCTGYDANNNPIWECGYVQVYNGSNWMDNGYATTTLQVVYSSDQTAFPFSSSSVPRMSGVCITVKDTSTNTYHYYNPKLDTLSEPLSVGSGVSWSEVNTVGYIQSSGATQSIRTGYYATENTGIEATLSDITLGTGSKAIFGSEDGTNIYNIYFYGESLKAYQYGTDNLGGRFTVTSAELSNENVWKTDKNKLYIGGTLKATTAVASTSFTSSKEFCLFGSTISSDNAVHFITDMKLYGFKIYSTGTNIVRNYIPIQYGSTYALYDRCLSGNVIYTNAGSGSFTGGGTSSPLTYTHTRKLKVYVYNGSQWVEQS